MAEQASGRGVILIVDDNPTNLEVLGEYLDSAGFYTLVATSGERAIQQVQRLSPDLILLDIIMPGIDGFETCRRLKADESTRQVPVVFMTAVSEIDSKVKAFALGGVDYITKPFQQAEVLARINAHLTIEWQKQELAELNATKDKFFSIISHDLKNAFHGIAGFAEFLYTSFDAAETKDIRLAIDNLYRSAENTSKLLENLLYWAQLQQDRMVFKPRKLDLAAVVAEQVALLETRASQKGIELTHSIPARLYVYADTMMVETIFRNLINNAIKFTHPGDCVIVSAGELERMATISVIDTGIGISKKYLAGLFEISQSYKRYGTSNEKGTGLGLTLCKEFVERNGGQINIESKVGKGTTVTFTLPLAEAD